MRALRIIVTKAVAFFQLQLANIPFLVKIRGTPEALWQHTDLQNTARTEYLPSNLGRGDFWNVPCIPSYTWEDEVHLYLVHSLRNLKPNLAKTEGI